MPMDIQGRCKLTGSHVQRMSRLRAAALFRGVGSWIGASFFFCDAGLGSIGFVQRRSIAPS